GAAIHQAGGAMIVESSTFEDNAAIHGAGGAIFTRSGSIEIINCSFKRNWAIDNFPSPNHELSGKGGAVCIHPDASALGAGLTFGQGADANIADANASTINDDDDIYGTIRSLPTVLSLSRIGPSLSRQDQATYFVTFSERVTGVDASDFAVTAAGIEQAHVTPEVRDVSGGSIYSVNVDTGIGSGLIELRLNDDDSIRNANGLSLGGTGAGNGDFASADALAIDRERPTVASIEALPIDLVAPNSITFLVTFDESVSDFDDAGDVFVEHQGTIHDRIEFSPISAAIHAVTISGVTGEGGIRLFVKANAAIDQVGNPSLVSAAYGEFYFDDVAPTVASFVAFPRRTSSPDIEFSLRFSEPVIGLSSDDLTIQHDGSRHASQIVERESEASYRVALSGVEGVGEMTVTLSAGAVTDRVGQVNALWTSDAFAIDTTPEIAPAASPVQESVDTPASSATDADGIAADGLCGAAMTPMAMVLPLVMALRRRRRGGRILRTAYARSRRALA
ncbi:MAG: hypothetical protein KDA32_05230, partial [Phycisphaerales bacterium]|nr:hypothetical protein [Phycisphaerales bacterium]